MKRGRDGGRKGWLEEGVTLFSGELELVRQHNLELWKEGCESQFHPTGR